MAGSKVWSTAGDGRIAEHEAARTEQDSLSALLRLLTLLANCGLNAGAPPVLESPVRR